jgi:CRISPR-associated endoribonuclease Cas6
MTYTKDSELGIAGLSVVLQSTAGVKSTPLADWLPELEHTPTWIPLSRREGVTKVMAALSQPGFYPGLMQTICQQISQSTAVEWQGRIYNLTGVEVDSSTLHVMQIPLSAAEPLPPTLGRAIHAQCFHWLAAADPAVAERLHKQDNFPITLAIKPGLSRQQMHLRIGLLQKELLAPLLWGLSQDIGGEITLTGIPCRLGKWVEILQASSFEALSQVPTQKVIDLQFLSPTSFKQVQGIQPFPLPELVFGNLLRRWNTFAPVELQFPVVEWKGLTSAYELKTYALKMKGGAEIGTQGWVRYEFPTEQAAIATVLAHFAYFAGVGRKTAMGMGQTKLLSESRHRG